MAAPLIKMDGKIISRDKVVWANPVASSSCVFSLVTLDGTTHSKTFSSHEKALEAYAVFQNLTEIDDLDGL